MSVTCFLIEPTGLVRTGLQRYRNEHDDERHFHTALVYTGTAQAVHDAEGYLHAPDQVTPHDDPRWPVTCECGYAFTNEDVWQDWQESEYRRTDTGATLTLREAPPGAMYDAWWVPWKGPDGRSLTVVCPDGHPWMIDGVASNCTVHTGDTRRVLPYDPDPASPPEAHRCWIRTGEPPRVTVGKAGHTCAAGAGSIATPGYHGFLRDGVFT